MAKKSRHVTITNWKGYKNYECNYCKFATLNSRESALHLDVHIRAGLTEAAKPAEVEDENYGLDKPKEPKKAKGKKGR